ncbi:MAG: hypothetical protein JSV91_06925 [Phycisphaerales bacterium]|nr:MAG: hypothetical protein JSV91_06925 [Phycisphaerales bacterium]
MQEQDLQEMQARMQSSLPIAKQRLEEVEAELKKIQSIPLAERDSAEIELNPDLYSFPPPGPDDTEAYLIQYRQQMANSIQRWEQALQANTAVGISYPSAIWEAVARPFSANSQATVSGPFGATAYIAPHYLHVLIAERTTGSLRGSDLTFHLVRSVLILATGLWILLFLPLSFILLPASRRKAKVRWRHIWRVGAYSLFIPLTCAPVAGLCVAIGYAVPSRLASMLFLVEAMLAVPMMIAIVLWWAVAIKRYLQMPHGAVVAVLLSILSVLVPFVVLTFLRNAF